MQAPSSPLQLPRSRSAEPASNTTASSKMPPKRPLRTYSKRTQPDRDGEPATKRRRTAEDEDEETETRAKKALEQEPVMDTPKLPSPHAAGSSARGSTIMHYFKPVAPSSSSRTATPKLLSSDMDQPLSSPASSPPVLAPKRKLGHSATRAGPGRLSWNPTDEERNIEGTADACDEGLGLSDPEEGGLKESSDNVLNRQPLFGRDRDKPKKKKPNAQKNNKKATVQTTLSLTMDANFTECKVCNILYNPYHAEDAKVHARRHAAVMRRKNRESH